MLLKNFSIPLSLLIFFIFNKHNYYTYNLHPLVASPGFYSVSYNTCIPLLFYHIFLEDPLTHVSKIYICICILYIFFTFFYILVDIYIYIYLFISIID